jgi:3-methylcrotonyl-CoA carboxylase alpha subunit
MRYEVRAGARNLRVETGADGRMLIDGRVVAYDVLELAAGRQWSITVEGGAHEVVLLGGAPSVLPGGPARMLVDGIELAVTATDERTLAAHRDRAAVGGGRREVRAPMPGLLKAVHVAEGDLVERNAALATLEAMKMENELRAPARGTVQRIAAAAGAKLESGALILVLLDQPAQAS